MMTKNEWIMLVVVRSVSEIKLYKNGELAFTMNTNDRQEYPDKVVLSVKENTCKLINFTYHDLLLIFFVICGKRSTIGFGLRALIG